MADQTDRFADLIALIGDAPVVFWQCPTHTDAHVEWDHTGNLMTPRCCECGATGTPR